MFEKHPVAVTSSILGAIMSIGIGFVWSKVDDIRLVQQSILQGDATQTLLLEKIIDGQARIEGKVEQLEDGQKGVASEVNRGVGTLALDVGRLMERTEGE